MNCKEKCLKVKIFQPKACYKTPFSLKGIDTFPLPTYSNLRGMVYTAMGRKYKKGEKYKEGDKIEFSIQGTFESLYRDYWNAVKYGDDGKQKKPIQVPTLHNIRLVIHICSNINDEIKNALEKPSEYLSVGRREDIIRIEEIREIEVEKKDISEFDKSLIVNYNAYVPSKICDNNLEINGVPFRLPSFWEIEDGFRIFKEMIDVIYIESPLIIESGKIKLDSEGDPVWI
jgi:CRISPR-associated protein Cas5t